MPLKDYNFEGYVIRLTEDALLQMSLSALEAYAIPHKGLPKRRPKYGLETYGTLWGRELTQGDGRTLYLVEFVSIDTSTDRTHVSCSPNPMALMLKKDIVTSFFPQYEFLGDFHTHPYVNCQEVRRSKGYSYSLQDYRQIEDNSDYWAEYGFRVGLVMTVVALGRPSKREPRRIAGNTVEFTLEYFRLWLQGVVAYMDEDEEVEVSGGSDEGVALECPLSWASSKNIRNLEEGSGV